MVVAVFIAGCGAESENESTDAVEVLDHLDAKRRRHDPNKYVEIDLGEYFVSMPLAENAGSLYVSFQIYGVIPADEQESFNQCLTSRVKRMRDGVIGAIQSSELRHLNDPSLAWLKSELVSIINKRLRCQILRDVAFTSYALERG